jgi:flagellar biosynthesis protein
MPDPHDPGSAVLSPVPPATSPGAQGLAVRQEAVALAYDPEHGPPRVVAKGRGAIAAAILERARTHGIYVHESRELLSLLMQVDLDRHIPTPLYRAVAELLAWLHQIDAGLLDSKSEPPRLTLPEHDVS